MQRYFLPDNQFQGTTAHLLDGDAKHIQRVMRMDLGDQIICCNSQAQAYVCELTEIEQNVVTVRIIKKINENPELPVDITIAQALPKGDKLDFIMQKGTELGASSFILFQSERSVVKWDDTKVHKKLERMKKIIKEAAEQSHRNLLPHLSFFKDLKQLLSVSQDYHYKVVAYEEEAKNGHHHALPGILQQVNPGEKILVLIGPEGGLTSDEVVTLGEADFKKVGLGRRILRTETAPLYALSVISYQFELLNEVN